ncbi:hypothetical protein M407DRAFT_24940 [Tulasnella calospora MUT 4182]|uniref:Uncharacterized protein n=1 Tax=Tulasnella calospora MUT 4182 TaxID=1051891 RepID=A0A0C3KWF9_9AGAM|nr:hypothetical protein M407DRAFT_24940 [Tulasnella calospora MUT 4182]
MFRRPPRPPTEATVGGDLAAKTASLKGAIVSTINGTEWPSESKGAAKSLLNTIESSPGIPNGMPSALQELQGIVEQYIRVLEDVHVRLKDVSSKTSMQKWNFLQLIRSKTTNRPSKCTLLLKTCQDDVSKAANSVLERLDQERNKGERSLVISMGNQLTSG